MRTCPSPDLSDSRSNLGCLAGVTKTCAPVDPAVHRVDGCTPPPNRSRAMADVVDNPSQHRFEMAIGDALAVAHYETEGGRVVLLHPEVPPELAGQGIGSKLARGVFETLRIRGARVVAKCEFLAAHAGPHPDNGAV